MWVVPKTKTLLSYVPDMEESRWGLKELSQVLKSELFVRSKPMQSRTWCKKLKEAKWMRRLSGRILKPSQEKSFTEKYTESLEGIPASHLAPRAEGKANKTPDTFFDATWKDEDLHRSMRSVHVPTVGPLHADVVAIVPIDAPSV